MVNSSVIALHDGNNNWNVFDLVMIRAIEGYIFAKPSYNRPIAPGYIILGPSNSRAVVSIHNSYYKHYGLLVNDVCIYSGDNINYLRIELMLNTDALLEALEEASDSYRIYLNPHILTYAKRTR